MSGNNHITSRVQIEWVKLNRKKSLRFAIFAIINKILIKKDRQIPRIAKRSTYYDAQHASRILIGVQRSGTAMREIE